jgi:hypothetical protein
MTLYETTIFGVLELPFERNLLIHFGRPPFRDLWALAASHR